MAKVGWHYPDDASGGGDDELELTNQVIGSADGFVQCLFRVFKRQYYSQHLPDERMYEWLVRADNLDEFRANLWELVRPHIKRAIEVRRSASGQYVFRWGDPAVPTVAEVAQFVTFCEKKHKKVFTWKHMSSVRTVQKWHDLEVILVIHEYSTSVRTRAVYQLLLTTFLNRKKPSTASAPVSISTPGRPPLRKDAVPKKPVLPPAADGYSFRDEVRALRETFSQMRSLMVVLDQRIMLLEQKCEEADAAVAVSALVKMDAGTGEGEEDEEEAIEEIEEGDAADDPLMEFKVEMVNYEEKDD